MQKTAMHSISTATRNQSKGEIFPDLTVDAFTAVATLVGKKQSIKKKSKHRFPILPWRQTIKQFMEQAVPRHTHLKKMSFSYICKANFFSIQSFHFLSDPN